MKLGIIGGGTVATGVVKIITDKKQCFFEKYGFNLEIKSIAVKNIEKERHSYFKDYEVTTNIDKIVSDEDIHIIVELIGGTTTAKELITKALNNKKHVVTANKELIAKHGKELFELANKNNVSLHIEASVAGGIPIIQTLNHGLNANKINKMIGIINGTTNYILTEMTQKKRDFAEVLAEAQKLGYAESDPTDDIEAFDALYKLTILSSLAFDKNIDYKEVFREGITNITVKDIEYAEKLGYIIKLLAIAKQNDDYYEARVHPAMLSKKHPLASVNGAFNAIWLNGDAIGDFMLYGRGAGELPTASAVLADILSIGMEAKNNSVLVREKNTINISSIDNTTSKYYLRIETTDKTGIIGIIGKDLGDSEVSIMSLWQEKTENGNAEIVLITHPVLEKNMKKAIGLLKESSGIKEISSVIRVED
ncbi:MAG: homoserine dehydrogenase [Candidatus Sericytochromatia bacterium]